MRIYSPDLTSSGEVTLSSEETQHALKVLRLKVGQTCELFDGHGNLAIAQLVNAGKGKAIVAIQEYRKSEAPEGNQICLGIGLPRGDRQRSVIERATELGVDSLVPLECEFSVAVATDNAVERAKRTVVESCKQCERNRLMVVKSSTSFEHWISDKCEYSLRLFCHPRLVQSVSYTDVLNLRARYVDQHLKSISIAIGPEGGFSEREVNLALKEGWIPLDLGSLILRVETALSVATTLAHCIKAR